MELFDGPPPTIVTKRPLVRSRATAGLLVLAVLYTLYFASDLVLPVLVSVLLAVLLAPLVGRLRRWRVPAPLAAGAVVLLLAGAVGWGVYALAAPAGDWLDRAPQMMRQIERKIRPVRQPVEEVRKATEQVQQLAAPDVDKNRTVKIRRFDLGEVFVVSLGKLAAQSAVVVFLVYFLLSSGDRVMRRLMAAPGTLEGKRRAVSVARCIKRDVATYLGLVTLINSGLGLATGLAMWALDMPNPALWGVLAGLLNFIPYAGAATNIAILTVVGLLTFDGLGRGLLPAGVFFLLANLEGNLITPMVVGQRLTLTPLLVFLSLVVWSWMWGVAGALLATPILVVMKVAAEHIDGLKPAQKLLSGDVGRFAHRRRSP